MNLDYALQKAGEHDSSGRCSIYAVAYDKRGRILSEAGNSYIKTSPVQARYARKAGMPHKQMLHAEIRCLLRVREGVVDKLVVARKNKEGQIMLAKPCPICYGYIMDFAEQQQHNITIEYTGENNGTPRQV